MSRSTYVDVEVFLDEFSTEDIIAELKDRNVMVPTGNVDKLIETIYYKRRSGQDYQQDLDDLIYDTIGRIA